MESIMLAIKYVIFFGMQAVVLGVVGITVLAGLYQLVRDKVQARRVLTAELAHTPVEHS
jgi:hypothetical protein